MKLKTLMLGVLAASITANLYSKSRRKAAAATWMSDAGDTQPGDAPMAEGPGISDTDTMFGSSSQHGPGPIGTGLSDFSRGA
jgi:hypothetical protein